jgi:hypothetical protein
MIMTIIMTAATEMEMHHLRRGDDFVRAMRCDFDDCSHDSSKEKIKIKIKAKDYMKRDRRCEREANELQIQAQYVKSPLPERSGRSGKTTAMTSTVLYHNEQEHPGPPYLLGAAYFRYWTVLHNREANNSAPAATFLSWLAHAQIIG